MKNSFTNSIKRTNIDIRKSSAYFFYIQVSTILHIKDYCFTYVIADLYLTTMYENPMTRGQTQGLVQLWRNGGLYSSGPRQHKGVVEEAFKEIGRDFVKAWKRDN